jgi:hypothetical protein
MQTPWLTIVGEVADVKLSSPDDPTKDQFYFRWKRRLARWGQPGQLNGSDGYARTGVPADEHIRLRTN